MKKLTQRLLFLEKNEEKLSNYEEIKKQIEETLKKQDQDPVEEKANSWDTSLFYKEEDRPDMEDE